MLLQTQSCIIVLLLEFIVFPLIHGCDNVIYILGILSV